MFGYLAPDKKALQPGERGLLQTFMCGVCVETKRTRSGNFARNFVGHDINFFNVLFTAFSGEKLEIVHTRCAGSPFKKRTVPAPNAVSGMLSRANIILTYYKLCDDVADDNSAAARLVRRGLEKAYEAAKTDLPEFGEAVRANYGALALAERAKKEPLDALCHHFASISRALAECYLSRLTGAEEIRRQYLLDLCYNVGKWIYLIDALCDLERDLRRKKFNPLACEFASSLPQKPMPASAAARALVRQNFSELEFLLFATLNTTAQNYNDLNLQPYRCLLTNVLYTSMRDQTRAALDKYKTEK